MVCRCPPRNPFGYASTLRKTGGTYWCADGVGCDVVGMDVVPGTTAAKSPGAVDDGTPGCCARRIVIVGHYVRDRSYADDDIA